MFGDCEVKSQVILGIHDLAVIGVLTVVRKRRLYLGAGQLPERSFPEQFGTAFFRQFFNGVVIDLPECIIDLEEVFERVAEIFQFRSLGQNRGHGFIDKGIGNGDRPGSPKLRFDDKVYIH